MTERTRSAPPSPLPLCVHTAAVGRSVGPLSNFFLQKRKGGKPHSLAGWLPPMLPGNCWSKSHSIGPARRLLWLRPRLDGEFKLKPSQIWVAMACDTMLSFLSLMLLSTSLYSHIAWKKIRIASPGLTTRLFYDSRLSHNLQSYHGEGRATITRYNFGVYQLMPILGSKVKTGKLHLQNFCI